MDEKRFNEILDEEYQNENFRPLADNRDSVKAIRAKYAGVNFQSHGASMDDKQINEVYENMKYA